MKNLLSYFIILFIISSCGETTTSNNIPTSPQETSSSAPKLPKEEPKPIPLNNTITYDYDTTQWTELIHLDSTILIDLRYATDNNFVKEKMYDCARCFLRPEAAKAVLVAHQQLKEGGLGLKMYDCYRPRPVQQKLWDKVPNASYVTPPSRGSMHNRGTAVDLTIVDTEGNELDMGTDYDFFGREAHQDFTGLSEEILANRKLLKSTMAAVGLKHIRTEWWHYSYPAVDYELSDMLWPCDNAK